ncbi:glycoside hydrolase family 6 protein [Actinoplanes sp. LDG1-01]|uniref:Glucanase n=1 Tax=Paractinoplanes lichenicola TaxID=2802976 RepID=A0ABS1W342_9ACTN|nr:glycoside hydrolase family 6 protein [Actinoplanes lichenicola]
MSAPPSSAPPSLYVDPAGPAVEQVKTYEALGRTADAALIREIADRPVAAWFADEATDPTVRARALVTAAAAAGKVPVLTLYRIPQRDCGSHSGGGATTAAEYTAWVASIAAAITGQRAIVVVEPDAVAQAVQGCLTNAERTERYKLLGSAIDTLSANPQLKVYLDGGNPSWITDTATMGDALKKAGVGRADGFALNVANFETTAANVTYGTKLSKHLGGAHFVIDTSRNGNGPAKKTSDYDGHWCNPPGRALGNTPTLQTGHKLVDAYLWIKRPGESDGPCGNGAPAAGQWWADYALGLARG